jgi:hypothetical protein
MPRTIAEALLSDERMTQSSLTTPELVETLLLADDEGHVYSAQAWATGTNLDATGMARRDFVGYSFRLADGTPLIRRTDDSFTTVAKTIFRRASPLARGANG